MKLKHLLIIGGVVVFLIMLGTIAVQKSIIKIRTTESAARLAAFKEYKQELKKQRASDSTDIAELKAMNLSAGEIKELFPAVIGKLEQVDKKLKNIEANITVASKTEVRINTHLRDSTVFDTIPVKTFSHLDNWIDLNGIVFEHDVQLSWSTWDTLDLFLERGRGAKRFIFNWWRYGPKEYPLTIKNSNPNSTLYYARYLKVRNKHQK